MDAPGSGTTPPGETLQRMEPTGPIETLPPGALTERQQRSNRLALRLLVPLLVLLAAIVVPLYLVYDVSTVSGASMEPTLLDGEHLLITRGWSRPHRGDILVLHWAHMGIPEEIVKRVVALPGDKVAVRGDHLLVNGAPETFPHKIIASSRLQPDYVETVPAGTVFVAGDNRIVSLDSRYIGTLPLSSIHGRVVGVWWPLVRMRVVPSP